MLAAPCEAGAAYVNMYHNARSGLPYLSWRSSPADLVEPGRVFEISDAELRTQPARGGAVLKSRRASRRGPEISARASRTPLAGGAGARGRRVRGRGPPRLRRHEVLRRRRGGRGVLGGRGGALDGRGARLRGSGERWQHGRPREGVAQDFYERARHGVPRRQRHANALPLPGQRGRADTAPRGARDHPSDTAAPRRARGRHAGTRSTPRKFIPGRRRGSRLCATPCPRGPQTRSTATAATSSTGAM